MIIDCIGRQESTCSCQKLYENAPFNPPIFPGFFSRPGIAEGEEGVKCLDWFMYLREIPKSKLDLPPMWK
jgi:hypothetical protein